MRESSPVFLPGISVSWLSLLRSGRLACLVVVVDRLWSLSSGLGGSGDRPDNGAAARSAAYALMGNSLARWRAWARSSFRRL